MYKRLPTNNFLIILNDEKEFERFILNNIRYWYNISTDSKPYKSIYVKANNKSLPVTAY